MTVLKAASLTKRTGSDNWYYRRTIPADVLPSLRKKASRPVGWYRTHISITLGTADRTVARLRGAEVAANVERTLAQLRGASSVALLPFAASSPAAASKSLTALAEAWETAAIARNVRARDARRWKAVIERFQKWLGHDDLGRLTLQKVQEWGDERSAAGIMSKTINDTDFAALRAVFGWGKKRGWLSSNPADEARIEGRGKKITRDSFFSPDEASAILTTALAVSGSPREKVTTTAAKRWVPWLCAYSGARVVEMIQLRKQDVRRELGGWVMRITPEAGNVKTNRFRDVPIHEHVIALGFLQYVEQAKSGPLFCELGKDQTTNGPAQGVYKRILEQARRSVRDPNVQPNHAWRYTFKTYGYEAGLDELSLDAICGHAAKTKGQGYTKITLKKRMDAMENFPRYRI